MGLRRCSPDDAYAELAEMSRNHNIKVHDLAQALARYAAEGIRTVPVDDREMKIALLVAERWVTHLPGGVNPPAARGRQVGAGQPELRGRTSRSRAAPRRQDAP